MGWSTKTVPADDRQTVFLLLEPFCCQTLIFQVENTKHKTQTCNG